MRQLITFFSLLIALVQPATAASWTSAEIRGMPPYCAGRFAREENNMQEYKRWETQYGPSFLHTHHLCHGIGLLDIKYPKARTDQEKRGILDEAMGQLGYMLNHASSDFALMPDVYLYRGIALTYMKKDADALTSYLKALELNPKFSPGYTRAANLYVKLGSKDLALKKVTEGLQHLPGNKGLQRLYEQLGGKQPYPEPFGEKDIKTDTSQTKEAASGNEPANATSDQINQNAELERNSVVYSFSRVGSGGMQHGYNAGDYVFLEIKEDTKEPEKTIVFKITTTIPQIHSRIQSIAFGLGRYTNLFTRLEPDQFLGKYYPVVYYSTPYTHPFWPKFRANYLLDFVMDPKIRKPNDARRLSPGNSLVIKANLGQGVRYSDVIQALKLGTQHEDGLIVAIIPHHLKGPPIPGGTRSDDGGYFTGRLLQASGPIAKTLYDEPSPKKTAEKENAEIKVNSNMADGKTINPAEPPAGHSEPKALPTKNSKNPWCRFCPDEN